MRKYLHEKYLRLLFGIAALAYFSYQGLTREKIESEGDLTEVQGKFLKYSFQDHTGYKRQGHQYYIWIDAYPNTFQIKADYLGIFRVVEFVTTVRPGNTVNFTIPKYQVKELNTNKNLFVTSIKVKQTTYLTKNEVLEIEKGIATSYADFYLAGLFSIAGLVMYLRNRYANN